MKKIYLSYARDDSEVGRRLLGLLRGNYETDWVDHAIPDTGQHMAKILKGSLHRVNAMVVLLSGRSLESTWIQFELGAAISLGLPIILVLLGESSIELAPDWFKQFKYVDARGRDIDFVASELMSTIERVVASVQSEEPQKLPSPPEQGKSKSAIDRSGRINLVIGIGGGTGSGKTTVANRILESVRAEEVVFIQQDLYYRDLKDLPLDYRNAANFDHPDALDNDLLVKHLRKLRTGESVELPIYDFRSHVRLPATTMVEAKPIIIVEGILIFAVPHLLEQMDIKVFVETPDDIRFIRRLRRDIAERGRTVDSVIEQYLATVRPMHMQFVEPSKRFADVIIPEGGHNLVSVDLISGKIRERLASSLHSAEARVERN